ncbi:MAG: PAC2 family protein [Actinobacteria bacterium]|uniref:Filament polymerization regulator ParJ n=1 Tax=Nostocoides veronense TaxID=330836 RepID=A0ABP4XKH1_9MICO|nr:PAC2 family protein [Actinomycetota bacterium]
MIELDDIPTLRDPVMLVACEGWNDAGEAATDALEHLATLWGAEPVAALDPEDYYDFQVNRPRVVLDKGRRRIQWRTTRILVADPPHLDRSVIVVSGIEPSFHWRAYTVEIMEFAQQAGVTTFITLGALMADVAHSRAIPVSATSEDDATIHRFDLEPSGYEGPTGIIGVLSDAATQAGLTTISCWAAVPHYAGHSPSPKATLALLTKLSELLSLEIDMADLPEEAQAWESNINVLAESDEEIAEYVDALEKAQDTADLPEASGDAIAREFERYLRQQPDES